MGDAQLVQNEDASSKDNQEEEAGSIRANIATDDEDSSDEEYPPTDEKYKQLEDRQKDMEIQDVPGLDLGDMGLVPGVVIPSKVSLPRTMESLALRCT